MKEFYKNKKVLVTGHTGFKGSWLCKCLLHLGANVVGISLDPPTNPNLFELTNLKNNIKSIICDIRDLEQLKNIFLLEQPEIVFHLAAQSIVRESYINPVYTYETNIMGTINILECIRMTESVKSFLNITTDKVYKNREWEWSYREIEELNGFDPYSNSKSCSELVTDSYKNSFFNNKNIAISTARAGNVIGGGDFADNRIIPDCIRAIQNNNTLIIRNPHSIRPYQHVLEPIYAYLLITKMQYKNIKFSSSYNIGPNDNDCITTERLIEFFINAWGNDLKVEIIPSNDFHEAQILKLDCAKIKSVLKWQPKWNIETAVNKIVDWTRCYINKEDINKIMELQIEEFLFDYIM
ncbi:MAG: CDP-glucose 4,6-dehydratase [Candidatus Epulonipiscioides saccharophilum]|nr:MAG: CDP-glucose 4,6-dehydratase [Epulopiscium sp. AS2M-Bin001]